MDLKKFNVAEKSEMGHEFEVKLPEIKTPTGAFITVRGAQSKKVREWARRKFAEMQQRDQIAKRRGKGDDVMSIEDAEDYAIESASLRVLSWKGLLEDGKALECNPENVKRILREHDWIREQVIAESDFLGNFIKA